MLGIVQRWSGSNASWVIDLISLFERVYDGVDTGLMRPVKSINWLRWSRSGPARIRIHFPSAFTRLM